MLTHFRASDDTTPLPDPKTFQSGDFVWPKKPDDYVPYLSAICGDPKEDENRWTAERDRFAREASRIAPFLTATDIERLRTLSFREFYARYVGGQIPDRPGVYAGSGLYVGHVGIIEIDQAGEPYVIEAISGTDEKVVRHSYQSWLAGRPGALVWHGRVRDRLPGDRAKIVLEATKCIGRPYDFWNLDLADDTAFYCSKLVWLSIYRALAFAIDRDDNPKRSFWFSPKQLLYLDTIAILFDPGVPYLTET